MNNEKFETDILKGTASTVPAADRPGQPDFAVVEEDVPGLPDPADTTSIRHGAQAVTGRHVWSASRMAVNGDPLGLYEQLKKAEDRRDAREARELANLAQWSAQMTTVGGVAMTNGEAQHARQHVIDNDEVYAKRAVERGDIEAGDKDAFKRGIRRKTELEEKRGRGTMTNDEAVEARQLEVSRVGRALDAATRDAHVAQRCQKDVGLERDDANKLQSESAAPVAVTEALFQNRRDITEAQGAAPIANSSPAALKVKAAGLDL